MVKVPVPVPVPVLYKNISRQIFDFKKTKLQLKA
jgi:hypothetical protein